LIAFYMVGIIAASWHFAYGVWLFAAKWGITSGEKARRRFGYVCFALAVGLVAIGLYGMSGFFRDSLSPVEPEQFNRQYRNAIADFYEWQRLQRLSWWAAGWRG